MATLFVMQGRDRGKRFELPDVSLTLGREASNRIQLNDSEVSRRHAEVSRDGQEYTLTDLGSSNGTFVNSEKIASHKLQSGDRVLLGRTLMIFTATDDRSSQNLVHDIDIVGLQTTEGSRIRKAVSHDEGNRLLGTAQAESPWLARARSNLQIMYRTALAVSHTLEIDQLLHRIMELIFEWVEADRGCVMLVDQESHELTPAVSRNRKGVRGDVKITISRTILDYVMEHKEGVLTSDARDDQRWDPAGSIVTLGVREAIAVPMQGRYGIVGVIYIDTYTPPGRVAQQRMVDKFSEEHLKLMVAIGHQAALAVEDTSYYSALLQSERLAAMGQTIATLSHHIKNILQGIRGGSFLIEEGLNAGENDIVRKGWTIVEKNQERISNLVMDMLTYSKDREPDLVPSDLNACVADVIELMQTRSAEAKVELVFQPVADLPMILFDADLLHRAVLNVVTNAIDACEHRDDARVTVSIVVPLMGESSGSDLRSNLVSIQVADNGEGIEPDDLKKIFSVFESRKGARGTGLGLPVSQKIMREHGGDVQVTSTLGVGSTFSLDLPAQFADARRAAGSGDTLGGDIRATR